MSTPVTLPWPRCVLTDPAASDSAGGQSAAGRHSAGGQSTVWHCGDPFGEQRAAERTGCVLDFQFLEVFEITGADAATWLNSLLAQKTDDLPVPSDGLGELRRAFILDAHGHIIEDTWVTATADGFLLATPREQAQEVHNYLASMIFWSRVTLSAREVEEPAPGAAEGGAGEDGQAADAASAAAPVTLTPLGAPARYRVLGLVGAGVASTLSGEQLAALLPEGAVAAQGRPRGLPLTLFFVPTDETAATAQRLANAGLVPSGRWTWDALRVAAAIPDLLYDVDARTLPHEFDSVDAPETGAGASVTKGCYRGQETVAKIHNVGLPPRRLVVLLVDASGEERPLPGTPLSLASSGTPKPLGRIGSVVDHYEYGPMALALIKRTVNDDELLRWSVPDSEITGTAAIVGRLSVHPAERKAGRDAVQGFRLSARNSKL